MPPRPVLLAALCAISFACESKPSNPASTDTSPPPPATASAQAGEQRNQPDPAVETLLAITVFHPIACRFPDSAFARCQDEVVGYDAALSCVQGALTAAKAELPKLPPTDVPPGCAGSIRRGVREAGNGTAGFPANFAT